MKNRFVQWMLMSHIYSVDPLEISRHKPSPDVNYRFTPSETLCERKRRQGHGVMYNFDQFVSHAQSKMDLFKYRTSSNLCSHLVVRLYNRIHWTVQLFATLEKNQFYDEQIFEGLAALLSDKLPSSLC